MVFFAFSTSASEGVQELYNALVQAYEGVTANGAGLVLCTKSEEGNKLFADAPFPVILYNDSLKAAVGKNSVMIEDEETANTASWYVNGSFLSAWSLKDGRRGSGRGCGRLCGDDPELGTFRCRQR